IKGEVKWDICKTPRLMRSLMRLALLNIAFTPSARKETATEPQTSCRLPNKFLLTKVREMTTRAIFFASCFTLMRQAVSLFEIFNEGRLDVCARGGGGGVPLGPQKTFLSSRNPSPPPPLFPFRQ